MWNDIIYRELITSEYLRDVSVINKFVTPGMSIDQEKSAIQLTVSQSITVDEINGWIGKLDE